MSFKSTQAKMRKRKGFRPGRERENDVAGGHTKGAIKNFGKNSGKNRARSHGDERSRSQAVIDPELSALLRVHRFVIGKRAVNEILELAPERIALILQTTDQISGVRTRQVDSHFLSNLVKTESHQGIVALVKPRQKIDLKSWIERTNAEERCLVLALDSVQDPHNVGALLRAAECFGVNAVLWSYNRVPSNTPVVSKASAGASELVEQLEVSNLAQALRELKEAGFWIVLTDADQDATALSEFDFPKRSVVILGSEGEGAKGLTKKLADFKIYIPMRGRLSSLNVSQAGAVVLNAWSGAA